jgi:hypothetical protein
MIAASGENRRDSFWVAELFSATLQTISLTGTTQAVPSMFLTRVSDSKPTADFPHREHCLSKA